MVQGKDYVIRGGVAGRERLRILSRIMYASTASLFDRFGFKDGQQCFDIGLRQWRRHLGVGQTHRPERQGRRRGHR